MAQARTEPTGGLPERAQATIADALIQNQAAPRDQRRSALELAQLLGVSVGSVHQAASRLRRAGRLERSQRQFTRAVLPPKARNSDSDDAGETALLVDANTLLEGLDQEAVLDDQGRRRVLSRLARVGPAPVKVSAVVALERHDRERGHQVGPPEPVTDDEHASRLARMIYGAGVAIATRAWGEAVEMWERDGERGVPVLAEPAEQPAAR